MQKSLSFSKGITASPSDLLADDTELTESVGLIFRDGEMHPIQNPVTVARVTDKLIFVHRTPDSETLIAYDPDRQVIHLLGRTPSGDTTGDAAIPLDAAVRSVSAVGNTLVIATDNGLRYLLLKAGRYVSLGSELPKPSVSFSTVYSGSTLNLLTNLMQQEQLPADDYYGWTALVAGDIYAYNKRINIFRANRLPFRGFCDFTAYGPKRPAGSECQFFVHIVSDTMNAWVKSDTAAHIPDVLNSWFFYPDPNATELIIWDTAASAGQRIPLKRHPMLNGAYSFSRLPLSDNFTPDTSLDMPAADPSACETLSSQIFTSVVNNPFVFQASGDNTVGTGSILALAANTEPISQGQFGQYPLIVFTTEGVYAMAVSDEGLYSASYPISREVCNNPASVTPTGRLVFFTSAKGLMAVSGGTVSCLSAQLDGRNPSQFLSVGDGSFLNFLSGALLAYDYRDSLLHILNPAFAYEYVYSIPYATFAKALLASAPVASVSAYPDTLIQLTGGTILSLAAKPSAADDTALYDATFTTRPLKLGSSLQLKTIHRIVHLLSSDTAHLALAVHASNDCRHWCQLKSLHGKPWKYYTLTYTLTSLHADDTFAGSVIDFQQLLPDKIR